MTQPMMKAQSLTSAYRQWRSVLAPDELEAVRAALPDATRELFDHPPMPFTWIEWSHAMNFSRAVVAAVGEPRAVALHREVGGRVVTEDLTTIYRMLLRVVSVELALRRSGVVWAQYVRDAGEVAVLRIGPRHVRAEYRGVPDRSPMYVAFASGALIAVMALCGARSPRCVAQGVSETGFELDVRWD